MEAAKARSRKLSRADSPLGVGSAGVGEGAIRCWCSAQACCTAAGAYCGVSGVGPISGELSGLGMSANDADKSGEGITGGGLRFTPCFCLLSRYVRMADGGGGSL